MLLEVTAWENLSEAVVEETDMSFVSPQLGSIRFETTRPYFLIPITNVDIDAEGYCLFCFTQSVPKIQTYAVARIKVCCCVVC